MVCRHRISLCKRASIWFPESIIPYASVANIVLKVSLAYDDWCDVLKLASLRDVAGGDKRNKPHHSFYMEV